MKNKAELIWCATIALAVAAGIATGIGSGCAGPRSTGSTPASHASDDAGDQTPSGAAATLALSGAQLWSMNCAQCHNNRNPKDYSDAQWEVAVMHMRVQARLTGEEEREIARFLKASN